MSAKTFWVEYSGRWRGTNWGKDGTTDVITDYESREAADRAEWAMLSPLYKMPDGRELMGSELPPGATYAREDECYTKGPDGLSIWVVCPDGWHWGVDTRASNCTMKEDKVHRCWVRHGDPRKGTLHVDKNGCTCNAGGGSIQTPKWHGFLTNGVLQENR